MFSSAIFSIQHLRISQVSQICLLYWYIQFQCLLSFAQRFTWNFESLQRDDLVQRISTYIFLIFVVLVYVLLILAHSIHHSLSGQWWRWFYRNASLILLRLPFCLLWTVGPFLSRSFQWFLAEVSLKFFLILMHLHLELTRSHFVCSFIRKNLLHQKIRVLNFSGCLNQMDLLYHWLLFYIDL